MSIALPAITIMDGTMEVSVEERLLFSAENVDTAVFDSQLSRVLVLKKAVGLPRKLQSFALDGSQQFVTSAPDRSRFNYFQNDETGAIGVVCVERRVGGIGAEDWFYSITENGSLHRKSPAR